MDIPQHLRPKLFPKNESSVMEVLGFKFPPLRPATAHLKIEEHFSLHPPSQLTGDEFLETAMPSPKVVGQLMAVRPLAIQSGAISITFDQSTDENKSTDKKKISTYYLCG